MDGIGLQIGEDEQDLDEMKQLKAKLPIRQHLKLQQLKILEGQNLSETVRLALEEYFERLPEQTEEEPDEASSAS